MPLKVKPKTILNWVRATILPRNFAGDISALYIGAITDEPPTANPPKKRKTTNESQFQANALPTAESK